MFKLKLFLAIIAMLLPFALLYAFGFEELNVISLPKAQDSQQSITNLPTPIQDSQQNIESTSTPSEIYQQSNNCLPSQKTVYFQNRKLCLTPPNVTHTYTPLPNGQNPDSQRRMFSNQQIIKDTQNQRYLVDTQNQKGLPNISFSISSVHIEGKQGLPPYQPAPNSNVVQPLASKKLLYNDLPAFTNITPLLHVPPNQPTVVSVVSPPQRQSYYYSYQPNYLGCVQTLLGCYPNTPYYAQNQMQNILNQQMQGYVVIQEQERTTDD